MSILTGSNFEAHGQVVQTTQAALARATEPAATAPIPGVEDGHVASSPNDADIGEQEIVKHAPEYQPITLSLGSPIFYTSNAFLTPNHEKGDVILAPTAAAYYDPRITRTLYLHFGGREQIFYYGDNHSLNFGTLDADAGVNYFVPELNNLMLRAYYDFNRLTLDDRLGDEFFSNHTAIFNAELPIQIGRAQHLSLGADANISLGADHQSPRHNDYEAYLGYTAALTRAFSVNAGGRVVLRDYHQNDRQDVSEILSVTATYWITNWCALSAISSFAHNDSNQNVFDYDVANVGGAVALTAKF